MFSLSYSVELNPNPLYPLSKETSHVVAMMFVTEQDVNEYLDILAERGTILETNLVEL